MAKRDPYVDRLLSMLDAKNIRRECPICDNPDWEPMNDIAAIGIAANVEDAVRALGLACSHCGFVRLHAAAIVED